MTPGRRLANVYALWVSRQEVGAIEPGTTVGAWTGATLATYGLIGGSLALGELRRGDVLTALLAPVPVVALGFTSAILRQRGRLSCERFLACAAVGTGLLVFAFAVLLLLAVGSSAWLFSAIVILAASLHSWTMKSAADSPIAGVAVVSGMGLAFAAAPRTDSLSLFLLTLGVSAYLSLQIGTWSARAYAERRHIDAYREALQAQLLAEQVSRIGILRESLTDLMARRHDHRNLAFALAMNVTNLEDELHSAVAKETLADLQKTVEQMNALIMTDVAGPSLRDEHMAALEPACLADVANDVARLVRLRYGDVRVTVEVSAADPPVLLRGGTFALHRILMNLMLNAREGDGEQGRASEITLRSARHAGGDVITVELVDDGPGFPKTMLDRRMPFTTTKSGGSGLGLVTVEALVAASGGTTTLKNGEPRGAIVALQLAVASR